MSWTNWFVPPSSRQMNHNAMTDIASPHGIVPAAPNQLNPVGHLLS